MTWFEIIVISIVQGVTEFLPVSSTGHMILTKRLLGLESTEFSLMFIVNIQFGAILAVVFLYWERFFRNIDFYLKLLVALLPAVAIGFLVGNFIDMLLQSVTVVAVSLLAGGVVLIFVDRLGAEPSPNEGVTYRQALVIGLVQCVAMIPGVSRSAATIVGGMIMGLSRREAAEFSFFLAVPTMIAASTYKIVSGLDLLSGTNLPILIVGNIVAFLVAMAAIKFLIAFLTRYGFRFFGYYRIAIGALVLALLALGFDLQIPG